MKLPVLALCSFLGVESVYTRGPTAVERRMESSLDKCASYGESVTQCARRVQDELLLYDGYTTTCAVTTTAELYYYWMNHRVEKGNLAAICGLDDTRIYGMNEEEFQASCISASNQCGQNYECMGKAMISHQTHGNYKACVRNLNLIVTSSRQVNGCWGYSCALKYDHTRRTMCTGYCT